MPERRFPPPWTVEEYRGISYIVRDANNFAVAYVYFENEPGGRAAAKLMTKDEARKIAAYRKASRVGQNRCRRAP
jgi:hypothetical protein